MNIKTAANNTLAYLDNVESIRDEEGSTPEHAKWMLKGIALGYIQHEKAHRWLGWAQAITALNTGVNLATLKKINKES